jgi:hypothetical protein
MCLLRSCSRCLVGELLAVEWVDVLAQLLSRPIALFPVRASLHLEACSHVKMFILKDKYACDVDLDARFETCWSLKSKLVACHTERAGAGVGHEFQSTQLIGASFGRYIWAMTCSATGDLDRTVPSKITAVK